ncbi:hypothetical protein BGY98DRAFT_1115669 [Russula aff. rugulosa BPL654]|nr:hypothetical protein BGY98DRAFT_1115669 [Russula aff. rugulosa BPL654]
MLCKTTLYLPWPISLHIHRHSPFAVKGGGHATNPDFSSTPGVQISMTRFNEITVEIGAGLTWTDVYTYLIPKGLNVIGGRLNGVGVAGLTLGGGYSWKTNQYGLTVDTVTEFHLVSPNGTQMVVTETDKDLWFALKGGLNNYGIVTKFVLKLYPQTNVWGAALSFEGDLADKAEKAFAKFLSRLHDHKAAQLGGFTCTNGSVEQVIFGLSLFYDGPEPPIGLYDELLNLSSTTTTIFKGNFTDFISTQFSPSYNRVYFDGVPMLQYTEPIINAFKNETKTWGYDDSILLEYSFEPFEPDFLSHGGPSAYPPNRSLAVFPSSIAYGWTNASADGLMADSMRRSAASLVEAGIQNGQDLENAATYVNLALFGTPLKTMYGGHLGRLREIEKYDPDNVMGLAGGWKF